MSKLWRGPLVILAAMNFGCGGTGTGPTTATNGDGVPQGVAGLWTDQDEEVWQLKADGTFSDYEAAKKVRGCWMEVVSP